MKMLMIICDDNMLDSIHQVLAAHQVTGYTEVPGVHGVGHHGEKRESAAAPGAFSLLFSAVRDEVVDPIIKGLEEMRDTYQETIPFGLRIFVMDVQKMV